MLSAFKQLKLTGESEELWKKKELLHWILNYVSSYMKNDVFTILLDQRIMTLLENNELTENDLIKVRKQVGESFREIVKDRENGMLNPMIRLLCKNAAEIGIDQELSYLIHDIFVDLALRKMKVNNSMYTKLEQFVEKLKISVFPEDWDQEDQKFKANIRIRIPMVEDKEEAEGDEEERDGSSDAGSVGKAEDKEEEKPEDQEEDENKEPTAMKEDKLEDKVILINPNGEEERIYVTHQYAGRLFREDIIKNVKKQANGFSEVDLIEDKIEELAEKVERFWFDSNKLPIFDFEIN